MSNVDKTVGDMNGLNKKDIIGSDDSCWVCKSIAIGDEVVLYCQDRVSGLILVSLDQSLQIPHIRRWDNCFLS